MGHGITGRGRGRDLRRRRCVSMRASTYTAQYGFLAGLHAIYRASEGERWAWKARASVRTKRLCLISIIKSLWLRFTGAGLALHGDQARGTFSHSTWLENEIVCFTRGKILPTFTRRRGGEGVGREEYAHDGCFGICWRGKQGDVGRGSTSQHA